MTVKSPEGKSLMVVMSVIAGEWYISDDSQAWIRHQAGEIADAGEYDCTVCGEPITAPGFSGEHVGDDEKAHWECVKVVIADEVFSGYEDHERILNERNLIRMTEDVFCQFCLANGREVAADILMPTYPIGSPKFAVYAPMCQECADKRDVPPHQGLSDLLIVTGLTQHSS